MIRLIAVCSAAVASCLAAAVAAAPPTVAGMAPAVAKKAPAAAAATVDGINEFDSLRLAVEDLAATFGERYPKAGDYLARLAKLKEAGDRTGLDALRAEALLANPLLDFDKLLIVRRSARNLGLPQNWQGNCAMPRSGFDNEIAVLSPVRPGGTITTVHKPAKGSWVGDVDLHFDADRILFSAVAAHGRWSVFELPIDPATGKPAGEPREVVKPEKDVDLYDACYLPDGRIIFDSTAPLQGVPCVGGVNQVANLYLCEPNATGPSSRIRRLCFDQDHDWCPTVLNDGRVMFTRWEYSDTPHYFTRVLMSMNPDGTNQMALYGSNSYWPNSLFYTRPIPGHPTKLVGIVSGHHGVTRMGELVVFDTAKSSFEADGAIQQIPGYGRKVTAKIVDQLVNGTRPKFLHPYPLSEKHFLVSCDLGGSWAVYLVDTFDNFVKLCEAPGSAMLEPLPLRKTPRQRAIPDKVKPAAKEAAVYLSDVYAGPGLAGVPRGTVKSLRLFAFDFGYHGLANHTYIGIDGPWDVHRILGTVPVEADGSASFRVPANTPISIQPLDADGRAVQIMRSWFVGMPGENVTCVGCHERGTDSPAVRNTLAMQKTPSPIEPWCGPARGFSFKRDVQPVLHRYCVSCHDGKGASPPPPAIAGKARRKPAEVADLAGPAAAAVAAALPYVRNKPDFTPGKIGSFTRGYTNLHPYVYRPGPESDYHLLVPGEYFADASELIQMLAKGHHGVTLSREAWQRLYAWIDLNVPDHGTWGEFRPIPGGQQARRRELRKQHAGVEEDYEAIPELPKPNFGDANAPTRSKPAAGGAAVSVAGWPFDAEQARKKQADLGQVKKTLDLGEGLKLELVLVPAGEFVMGDPHGAADEQPRAAKIDKPFWMGKCEVSNAQFARFEPAHDSRYYNPMGKDQSNRGVPMNRPEQPVVRVSWQQAAAFCKWLSEKTAERIALPTEVQWEWACRAGSGEALSYGSLDADFSAFANLADKGFGGTAGVFAGKWRPADSRFSDRNVVTANVGSYQPNAWGLHDMHGNATEWTSSEYCQSAFDVAAPGFQPVGVVQKASAENEQSTVLRVVRGGSFHDRPHRSTSAFRWRYAAWQAPLTVGFRVICEVK